MSANGSGGGQDGQRQTSGPSTITSPNADTRTLNHRGTEVGDSNVDRSQNQAGRLDEIISWTVPKKFRLLVLAGGKHFTKAELRAKETFSGDGSQTTFSLNTNLVAISGEEKLGEQPFPVVVAYDTDAGSQLEVESVDYYANEVTFASPPNNAADNVEVWPVMGDGVIQYRAEDAFGHLVGPLDEWGVPAHVFADFDQEKNTTQIHLPGAGRFERDEALNLYLDAPRQVVWEDANYPEGEYVSKIEQRVDVQV